MSDNFVIDARGVFSCAAKLLILQHVPLLVLRDGFRSVFSRISIAHSEDTSKSLFSKYALDQRVKADLYAHVRKEAAIESFCFNGGL